MDAKLTLPKLVILLGITSSVFLGGCSSGADATTSGPTTKAKVSIKGGKEVGASPTPGLNPNYHGSAATDDAKVGTAVKGGN